MDKDKIIVCKSNNSLSITYCGKRMIVTDTSLFNKDKEYIKNWYINLYRKGEQNG